MSEPTNDPFAEDDTPIAHAEPFAAPADLETPSLDSESKAAAAEEHESADIFTNAEPPRAAEAPAEAEVPLAPSAEAEDSSEPFAQLDEPTIEPSGPTIGDVNALRNVNLEVIVELGRTKLSVDSLTGLQTGAVVPLNKIAGQALEIIVGGKAIASGEVVVIDGDTYAIRITEIYTPAIAQPGALG